MLRVGARHNGRVARISHEEGFGFIAANDGTELYFHRDNVAAPRFERLKAGDEVRFVEEHVSGRPQAKRISAGK